MPATRTRGGALVDSDMFRGEFSMSRKVVQWIMLAMSGAAAVGCASIFGGSEHDVAISSEPEAANITVINSAGDTVFTGTTPATVKLKGGKGYFKGEDYTVNFSKSGFGDASTPIKRGVSGWYVAGNLVIGGLIGWLIVDPITGAMYTLDKRVLGVLQPVAARNDTGSAGDAGLHLVTLQDLPAQFRDDLVRIN